MKMKVTASKLAIRTADGTHKLTREYLLREEIAAAINEKKDWKELAELCRQYCVAEKMMDGNLAASPQVYTRD